MGVLKPLDGLQGPDPYEHFANQVRARYGAPRATVTRVVVPITHHEIVTGRHRRWFDRRTQGAPHRPLLIQHLAIHVNRVALGVQVIARQTNHSLHEIGDIVAAVLGDIRGRLEDHDVANVDSAEFNAELVHNDSVTLPQRWIHGTGRDVESLKDKRANEEGHRNRKDNDQCPFDGDTTFSAGSLRSHFAACPVGPGSAYDVRFGHGMRERAAGTYTFFDVATPIVTRATPE
jgi:hypothetical protein